MAFVSISGEVILGKTRLTKIIVNTVNTSTARLWLEATSFASRATHA